MVHDTHTRSGASQKSPLTEHGSISSQQRRLPAMLTASVNEKKS